MQLILLPLSITGCSPSIFVQGAFCNAKPVADLFDRQTLIRQQSFSHCPGLFRHRRPTTLASPCPGGFQSGLNTFSNQIPLEFGQCTEHMKKEPAPGSGGVNILGQGVKTHSLCFKLLDHFNKMGHGAAHAVEFPHYQRIALPAERDSTVKPWPFGPNAAGRIGKELYSPWFTFEGRPQEGMVIANDPNGLSLEIAPMVTRLSEQEENCTTGWGIADAVLHWNGRTIHGRVISEHLVWRGWNRRTRTYTNTWDNFQGFYLRRNSPGGTEDTGCGIRRTDQIIQGFL